MNKLNISDYYIERDKIVEDNVYLVGNVLNKHEKKVDEYLDKIKHDFKKAFNPVPYNMPVLRKPKIWDTDIYDFCLNLPKGSDLHVHGTSLMPMKLCIDFCIRHPDLLICLDNYVLYTKQNKPKDKTCLTVKQALDRKLVSYEDLYNKWTINGVKHNENRWTYFENIFAYFEVVDYDLDLLYDYYLEAFEYYVSRNIDHVEIHILIPEDDDFAYKTIKTIRKAYYKVKDNHPQLIVSLIGAGMKLEGFDLDYAKERLETCFWLQQEIKDDYDPNNIYDFILGFDLINEEDMSKQLKDYAPILLEFSKKHPDFKYFLHCGESLEPKNSNLIDAYLLGASRVGHGLNLYRYPNLLKDYVNKEICLEICPISNQVLQYTKDIRLHPALEYIKRGLTISLCSDDPMYFENETLTDDFLAAIICWDLHLADIKQLCINSIMYSAISKKQKHELLKQWKIKWETFIDRYKNRVQ